MIVLDTHAWVWWVGAPEKLSPMARATIDGAASRREVHVSSISAWEVAMLVAKGRLTLTMDTGAWIKRSELLPQLTFCPVDNAIALRSVNLPGTFHSDPADRIIVATTLALGAKVVTRDRKIQEYPHVDAVW